MGSLTPRPSARPRVKVVLPAPTSPMSSMTWLFSDLAKFLPKSSISCSDLIIII